MGLGCCCACSEEEGECLVVFVLAVERGGEWLLVSLWWGRGECLVVFVLAVERGGEWLLASVV